jgi:hypothetical protein
VIITATVSEEGMEGQSLYIYKNLDITNKVAAIPYISYTNSAKGLAFLHKP